MASVILDISNLAGTEPYLRFRLKDGLDSDTNSNDMCDDGWSIDNIKVLVSNYNVVANQDPNQNVEKIARLQSSYPNPFNPTTTIAFLITDPNIKNSSIEAYNCKGQK